MSTVLHHSTGKLANWREMLAASIGGSPGHHIIHVSAKLTTEMNEFFAVLLRIKKDTAGLESTGRTSSRSRMNSVVDGYKVGVVD